MIVTIFPFFFLLKKCLKFAHWRWNYPKFIHIMFLKTPDLSLIENAFVNHCCVIAGHYPSLSVPRWSSTLPYSILLPLSSLNSRFFGVNFRISINHTKIHDVLKKNHNITRKIGQGVGSFRNFPALTNLTIVYWI